MRTIILLFVVITVLTSAVTGGAVYYWQLTNINNLITQNQADLDQLNLQIQDLQKKLDDIQNLAINDDLNVVSPNSVNTEEIGFIKSIQNLNGKHYVNIDYIETYGSNTPAGIKARIEDGICKSTEDCQSPSPFIYIRNINPQIIKFELANNANLNMSSYQLTNNKYTVKCVETIPQVRKVSLEELSAYVQYLNQLTERNDTYFKITLSPDNKIIDVLEMTGCLP